MLSCTKENQMYCIVFVVHYSPHVVSAHVTLGLHPKPLWFFQCIFSITIWVSIKKYYREQKDEPNQVKLNYDYVYAHIGSHYLDALAQLDKTGATQHIHNQFSRKGSFPQESALFQVGKIVLKTSPFFSVNIFLYMKFSIYKHTYKEIQTNMSLIIT